MHRDTALTGDKELSLVFSTLSSFVTTLSGAIEHLGAQVSFQVNFMSETENTHIHSAAEGLCCLPATYRALTAELCDEDSETEVSERS